MRDVGCAARWVRGGFGVSLTLHKSDGTPAVSAKEQGQVIAEEWRPRWTEIPETRFQRSQPELQAICDAFGQRVPPFPRPSRWDVRDIRRECGNTAAGIDGLSFKKFAGLPDLHLTLLCELYDAMDSGAQFPVSWQQARLVCLPKQGGEHDPSPF